MTAKTLTELLKLNSVDYLILKDLSEPDAKQKLLSLSPEELYVKIDALIRLAHHYTAIEKLLNDKDFDELFYKVYFIIASQLSETPEGQEFSLYKQENIPTFDQVRGLYFYLKSQAFNDGTKEYRSHEIRLLEQAIQYHCIQAMQRYHQHLYAEANAEPEKAPAHFETIIKHCKDMVFYNGSYAYLMLAEALCRKGMSLKDSKEAKLCFRSAMDYCDHADKSYFNSQSAINNASFGKGLKTSNSMGFEKFSDMRNYIIKLIYPKLYRSIDFLATMNREHSSKASIESTELKPKSSQALN